MPFGEAPTSLPPKVACNILNVNRATPARFLVGLYRPSNTQNADNAPISAIIAQFNRQSQLRSKPAMTQTICVYASSSDRLREEYFAAASDLGRQLGAAGHSLIYGGGRLGMRYAAALLRRS